VVVLLLKHRFLIALNPALALLALIGANRATAQTSGQRTYANPVDIDYRYNFEHQNQGISFRSGADPVIVVHRGEYYLFETIGEGYWHSHDLGTWTHITPSRWPLTDLVAPAVLSVRDTIYLLPSTTSPLPILMLTEPATGRVEFYNRLLPWLPMARRYEPEVFAKPDSVQPGPWDPQFFYDSASDRWFLYWNSSNVYPLHVIELDKTRRLAYKGTPRWLFGLDPEKHGWERFGQDHRGTIKPFIEGAWMTKHGGRYYLQYGAPGTEYNVYATGVYVASDPLGPFTYAPYNPVAYKPGGFVQGAGHGNTFQDVHGNWWNTGTPWIGVNWNFERRIGLHPAGFDGDGQMYVDTRFGDFPHWLPTQPWTRSDELFTGWMLLSYHKAATASSARDSFPANNTTDDDPRTYWVAGQNRPGEWLTMDLGRAYQLKAIQVNYADYKSGVYGTDSTVVTQFRLHASQDGKEWKSIADLSRENRDRPNAYIELSSPVRARYVRYEHVHVAAANLAISDIRVFGNGDGGKPPAPRSLTARRDTDERNAAITWTAVPGVVGYNLRWGIAPSKLYQTYQRFADQGTTLELRALTAGQAYWVAIESFDENGVSSLSGAVAIR
jgi:xylan 1,4-beta-xylosidase